MINQKYNFGWNEAIVPINVTQTGGLLTNKNVHECSSHPLEHDLNVSKN